MTAADVQRCPSDLELEALLLGDAGERRVAALHEHAGDCMACREVLATIARIRARADAEALADASMGGSDEVDVPLFAGSRVGRFVIERELGRGGMGIVYAARDATLHRTVAIKVLSGGAASPPAAVLAEARAMARVDHPNVVSVYEVSLVGEHIYLVMDFVDGPHLGDWVRAHEPSWRQIVARYLDAAQGLQAIHDAGLVHRDFKPHNVIVGSDGRSRVTDFGLVGPSRSRGGSTDSWAGKVNEGPEGETAAATAPGTVKGTPRYMAPEQLRGEPVTTAADQFALCASLYEALTGCLPFPGRTRRERLAQIDAGALAVVPIARRPPRALQATLVRGLRPDPRDRFDDLRALATSLSASMGPARRSSLGVWALSGLGALGMGAALWSTKTEPPCADAGVEIARVWNDRERAELSRIVPAGDAVVARIDAYAEAWRDADQAACTAHFVERDLPEATYHAMKGCLAQRREALRATLEVVRRHGDDAPHGISAVLDGLERPEACSRREHVADGAPQPADPDQRIAIVDAEATLASVRALRKAGLTPQARAEMELARPQVRAADWRPLAAHADAIEAELLISEGRPDDAIAAWRHARAEMFAAGSREDLARVTINGIPILLRARRIDEAERLIEVSAGQVAAAGLDDLEALVESHRGGLAYRRGDLEAAETHLRATLELLDDSGDIHGLAASSRRNLADVLFTRGRLEQAARWAGEAAQVARDRYGGEAVESRRLTVTHGLYLAHAGHFSESKQVLRDVISGLEGSGQRLLEARAQLVLGDTLRRLDDNAGAEIADHRAHALYLAALGRADPRTVQAQTLVGLDLIEQDRAAQALPLLREASTAIHWNPDNPAAFGPAVLGTLARALADSGDREGALEVLDDARVEVASRSEVPDDHVQLMAFALDAARLYERAEDFDAMLDAAAQADRIAHERDLPPLERADIAAVLERAKAHVAAPALPDR